MLLTILAPLVGVVGVLLLSFGAWLIYPPAGFVTAGAACLFWSWLVARYLDRLHLRASGGE
ncbi:hypothetical protein B7N92_11810 [Salmonella enterica subsp. enterica serovar Bovismorbificans]|nr:hypothetical protein [Salmonella enterica subsp. enterica serovar Typhimurium]EDG5334259.1 hypothetical protein [Salmonella enterica subsp. enterica serovar Bovismorbificans]